MPHCCVPLCTNRREKNAYFSFYRFPADQRTAGKWLKAIRRDFVPTINSRVCSWHFPNGKEEGPTRFHWNDNKLVSPKEPSNAEKKKAPSNRPPLQKEDKKLFQESKRRTRKSSKRRQKVRKVNENPNPKKVRRIQHPLEEKEKLETNEKQNSRRGRKILRPLKEQKELEKNKNPHPKRNRKILLPLEEQEKLKQALLTSTTFVVPRSISILRRDIFQQSTTRNEKVASTSTINHGELSRIKALPVLNIKTEPVEEGEILGPQLSNLLGSSVEDEDITKIKIKEEPLDDVPGLENFELLEPIVEMTFECEEPVGNKEARFFDGSYMEVKQENCHN